MIPENKKRFELVQLETIKVMDQIHLSVAKMDSWQKFHFSNKLKNFINLIDND